MSIPSILSMILAGLPPPSHEQSQAELEAAADAIIDQSPADAIAQLHVALTNAEEYPHELLADPSAPKKFARARLALAWAYLADGNVTAATATMDLAIRSAGAEPLPLAGLGPDVRKLHDQRRAALESAGRATISVDCDGCEVLIDEAKSNNPSEPLLLGSHRVWLFDPSNTLEQRFEVIALDTADATVTIEYRPTPVPAPVPVPNPDHEIDPVEPAAVSPIVMEPTPSDQPARPKVNTPRWAKIVGMSVGASLLVTGGVLLAIDGKCQGGGEPSPDNVDTCGKIWNHAASSYALLGVGGGLLLGASVWLGVDEARAGQRRASAMVGWTMRF